MLKVHKTIDTLAHRGIQQTYLTIKLSASSIEGLCQNKPQKEINLDEQYTPMDKSFPIVILCLIILYDLDLVFMRYIGM